MADPAEAAAAAQGSFIPVAQLPLRGVHVLDFTHAVIGPLTTRLLGDFGADIVKIEEPTGGDFQRARGAGLNTITGIDSPRWAAINFNKRSLAMDLHAGPGKRVLRRLIEWADVVVQNFRPQTAVKMGVDAASVMAVNPKVVYCSLSGYGETGPLAHRRGGDPYAQALAGIVATQGSAGEAPYLGTVTWVDHGGAAIAAFGIMLALRQRDATGVGQVVDTNLLDIATYFQSAGALADRLAGAPPVVKGGRGAAGAFPWGAYPAADGDVVLFLGFSEQDWPRMCAALGLPELANDPRFDSDANRRDHRDELYRLFDREFRKHTREEWAQRFSEHGVRCDPALTMEEMLRHPQVIENEIIVTCPTDGGPGAGLTIGNPLHLQGKRPPIRRRAPDIGEQSREILAELGCTTAEIDALTAAGVVRPQAPVD